MTAATETATTVVEEVVTSDAGKAVAVALGIAAGCVVVAWAARRIGEAADAHTAGVRESIWETIAAPAALFDPDPEDDEGPGADEYDPTDHVTDGGFVR